MNKPQCPKCGAEARLVSMGSTQEKHPRLLPVHAYRCSDCGMGFAFSEPPPRDPPDAKPDSLSDP
jgi:hypothetical protein